MGAAKTKAEAILGILQTFGIAISVIALIAIGIKYMLGSVEAKAEYKKTLIPYVVGAFMVFAVSILPQLIYDLLADFH
ncbi:MAG: hypothetical protein IKF38_07435 [Clostridia bacterium]|nr:hypothetical protein [Clostridia bacterium]